MAVTADRKAQVGELSSSSSIKFWTVFDCCLQILEKEVSWGLAGRTILTQVEYLTGNRVRVKSVTQDLVPGLHG